LVALNGVAVTHMVSRAAAAAVVTTLAAHALRAAGHQVPRDGEYAIPQLGRDIRTANADDDGGEDDATFTRRPTRRDGARDRVRPHGFADPTAVPTASINAGRMDAHFE
jgi:hypothetical protein